MSGDVTKASVLAEPSLRFGKLRLYEVTIVFDHVEIGVGPAPLADARTAGVGQHGRADRLEVGEQAVTLDGGARLFGAGRDHQVDLRRQAVGGCLTGDRRGPGDVLVGRVGARADQRRRRHEWPSVLPCRRSDAVGADLVGQVRGVRAVDERLELVEVDLDELVVERAVVGTEVFGDLVGGVGDLFAERGLEVLAHVVVVAEERGGGADLGAHVADRALARRRDRVGAGAVVLHDGAGAALDGELTGDLEDDVLRARPVGERAGELHADDLGPLDVPGEAGHHVDGIGATDADGDHAEAAGVGRVAVGADHHAAGERVVLEHDLVDDARAGPPESESVASRDGPQEVVDLLVGVDGDAEVDLGADLGLDEVVAVHGRRHGSLVEPGGHELEQRHLCGGVLHGDTVGVEVGVAVAALQFLVLRVGQVVDQDLLGERQRTSEAVTADLHVGREVRRRRTSTSSMGVVAVAFMAPACHVDK